ncbi:MAG: hypothetical protein NTY20_01455 [Candidatus Aenigmarchaeota archaeon]|nr:hypothetical protein [Candidatus Aenigmarchaeota archaeon]
MKGDGRTKGAVVALSAGMAFLIVGTFYTPAEFWSRTSLFGVGLVSYMCGLVLSKGK